MGSFFELHIEPLGNHTDIFVLKDEKGRSLGAGSREVLEVLRYIIERSMGLGSTSESDKDGPTYTNAYINQRQEQSKHH